MNWSTIEECKDEARKYQCVGDKANYYLENKVASIIVEKYNADCIYKKLKLQGRIADCFFRLIEGKKEKLILIEAKGNEDDYFEQLSASFDFFVENRFVGSIHGRFIGTKVPSSLFTHKRYKKGALKLNAKFVSRNGKFIFGNKVIKAKLIDFETTELILNSSKNSEPDIINL
jgi:hypothetical protein